MPRQTRSPFILTLIYTILGGFAGLAIAFALFLGPLNPRPQELFDTATGFVVLFFTAVLALAGVEIGSWMALRPRYEEDDDTQTQEHVA